LDFSTKRFRHGIKCFEFIVVIHTYFDKICGFI